VSENTDAAFLKAAPFIDSDHPTIVAYARNRAAAVDGDLARAIALYGAVRDGIKYDIYRDYSDPATFRASSVLAAGQGFCVGKAAVLAACCRAVGIPARVGYADVRNHMTSPRLHALTQTDVFYWHSYADIRINGTWVKATPAFDRELCARMGIQPLEFDGRSDSLFQPLDAQGRRRMEYVNDRGTFADVPFAAILENFKLHYPKLIEAAKLSGNFRAEAQADAPSDVPSQTP